MHGLCHTFGYQPCERKHRVYTLMKLLGHESLATSQRYVAGAGADTRLAAAKNPVYRMLNQQTDEQG